MSLEMRARAVSSSSLSSTGCDVNVLDLYTDTVSSSVCSRSRRWPGPPDAECLTATHQPHFSELAYRYHWRANFQEIFFNV